MKLTKMINKKLISKVIKVNSVQIQNNILSALESIISSWKKTKWVMGYVKLLINKTLQRGVTKQCSKVQEVRLKEDLFECRGNPKRWKDDIETASRRWIWFRY